MNKAFAEEQKGGLFMNIFAYICVSIVMAAIIFVFGVLLCVLLNSCDNDTDTVGFTVICLLSLGNAILLHIFHI